MRTFLAVLAGFVIVGTAVINERQQVTADEPVTEVSQVAEGAQSVLFVPLPSEEIALASSVDPVLQERIDALTERVGAVETLIPQPGRIDAIEERLTDVINSVLELQTQVTGIQDQLAAVPEPPAVLLPDPIQSTLAEWRSPSHAQYVLLFTTVNCGPCDRAKAEWVPWLEEQNWHVKVFEPNDPANDEYNTQTYPTWVVLEYGEEEARWTGVSQNKMEEMMQYVASHGASQTLAQLAAPPAEEYALSDWIRDNRTSGDWTYPGTIRGHLIEHGWDESDLVGLTTDEMIELHDATHEGRISPDTILTTSTANRGTSTSSSSSTSSSYSYASACPGGNCPSPRRRAMSRRGRFFLFN